MVWTSMGIVGTVSVGAGSVAEVVIFLADGVFEEFGSPEEVFGNPRSEKTRNFLQGAQNARDGLA